MHDTVKGSQTNSYMQFYKLVYVCMYVFLSTYIYIYIYIKYIYIYINVEWF